MIFEDDDHVTSHEDVKEKNHHKILAEEFIDSKERLADIINFLPDATFVIDSAGHVISWNHAMEDMTNVKASQIIGKGSYEYSIPFYGKKRKILIDIALQSDRENESKYDLVLHDKNSITAELYFPSFMGKQTYLWAKATKLYNNKGEVVGAIESIRDVTSQKKTEQELKKYHDHLKELVEDRTEELIKINEKLQIEIKKRKEIDRKLKESEKNYHSIFKHAGIGIFQSTPDGQFINVNITMAHLFGYESPEEMIESVKKLENEISVFPKKHMEILDIIQNGRGTIRFDNKFPRKNGENWIAELNLRVVKDKNCKPIYLEGFVQDVTSRKHNAKALQESELKYRTIFENTGTATLLIEKDTSITLVNSEFETISGYPKKEVIGKSWTEFVVKEDLHKMIRYHETRNMAPDLAPKNYEFQFIRKDKSIGYAYMNIVTIPGSSQRTASIIDISPRKNAEKELYKINEKLKRSNAELEQFAYVASHDLREPLRMITTFLELLEKKYKDQLDSDANSYIKYAVDGSKHLNNMINDLLDYARLTHNKIEFAGFDSEEILKKTLINLKSSIEENDAVVTHGKLPKIYCNDLLLFELFQNLIGNAIKYRGRERPEIHVSAVEKKDKYIFSIKDNGIGMSENELERIFEIFQRLHTREEYEGTGIGLAIAQKIVQQHGGKIWAESEPEKGTTFYFTLPK
jgi:two-component system, chemotaxis family, sensor kinase Cph1